MKYNIREKKQGHNGNKKKNNKSSEDNVTGQCDQYIAEVNECNTQQ
jgi:hypothetical protein